MDKDILSGIKFSFGIFLFFSVFFGLVWASGFHTANEILDGTFLGNYTFTGEVNLSSANLIRGNSNSVKIGWPDIIVCTDGSSTRYLQLAFDDASKVVYRQSNSADVRIDFTLGGVYSTNYGMSGYDCVTSTMSIQDLYDADHAFNIMVS